MSEHDRPRRPVGEEDLGGDPVCWAHLVCPECGRFLAEEAPQTPAGAVGRCPECGAELS